MVGWAAITQSTANCQLQCLECLHDKAFMRLTCKLLRLKLSEALLVTTGKKAYLVERLLQHEASYVQGTSGLSAMSRGCADPTPSDATDGTDDGEQDESTSLYLLAASGSAIAPPTPDGSSETSESSHDDQTASEETPDIVP